MCKIWTIIFSLLPVSQAVAQHTITGVVRSAYDNQPLEGATAQIVGQNTGAVTNKVGIFTLKNIPSKYNILIIKHLGYKDKYDTIHNLTADIELTFSLVESSTVTDEVFVRAIRASDKSATTFVNVGKQTIQDHNFGQDLPIILNWTPSVVTTSDAGSGIGYTGLRVRGVDATRVNVTINGIPYNDSESQMTYWVDIPDVASSTQSIQIQRGVGTSTNGAGAFGASLNLQTNSLIANPYSNVILSGGSFSTRRFSLLAGTGLIKEHWTFDAKVSKILSDGYVDRASSNLTSYYFSGGYYKKNTLLKVICFGGIEKTYQSWGGIDSATLATDRTTNFLGAIYNHDGSINRYYNNQVDRYNQNHIQMHASQRLNKYWNANLSLHYSSGKGYYEEYHQNQKFEDIGLPPVKMDNSMLTSSDLIVRKWLDNKFYGLVWSLNYQHNKTDLVIGGSYNQYRPAKHFGNIIWGQYLGDNIPLGFTYYSGRSKKYDLNIYTKWNYELTNGVNFFLDAQYRFVTYKTAGKDDDQKQYNVNDLFHFINPKAGISFSFLRNNILYGSFSIAHREPNRSDYLQNPTKPKAETLQNIELGWKYRNNKKAFEINYYYMRYVNQLVLSGEMDNVGTPIRVNVGKSYRTGIELSMQIPIFKRLNWNSNATLSMNRNKDFIVFENGSPVAKNTSIILSPQIIGGSQLNYNAFKNFQISLLSKYVGEQYLDNSEKKKLSLPAYFINDIIMSYTFHPHWVKKIGLSAQINNLLDTKYVSNGYVYDGTPYYFPQAGINYLLMLMVNF